MYLIVSLNLHILCGPSGIIWHKQSNRGHRRHVKSAGRLTRLKRLKPLAAPYARKMNKLGFK